MKRPREHIVVSSDTRCLAKHTTPGWLCPPSHALLRRQVEENEAVLNRAFISLCCESTFRQFSTFAFTSEYSACRHVSLFTPIAGSCLSRCPY